MAVVTGKSRPGSIVAEAFRLMKDAERRDKRWEKAAKAVQAANTAKPAPAKKKKGKK